MLRIRKIVIGIRPVTKMFRVSSLGGEAVDSVLDRRGTKPLSDDYYSQVATNMELGAFRLSNEKIGNELKIDRENVVFTKHHYGANTGVVVETAIAEFATIWSAIDDVLRIKDVRRIGIIAEHRFKENDPHVSATLMKALTIISPPVYPAKFMMRYEERRATAEGLAPDIKKSDFVNVIRDYYDAELDTEHPEKGSANANIDVQRYYAPPISGNIIAEVRKLGKIFNKERELFIQAISNKGVNAGES
ncbi:hypothetical protein [Desulfococcus sp.]|uniref:hypothetical protein n=1 Tax=Desulfococcus sp. TaxID=2025834 RepID=UPI003594579E